MAVKSKKQKDKRQTMVRVMCVFLCVLMVFSLIGALFGIF